MKPIQTQTNFGLLSQPHQPLSSYHSSSIDATKLELIKKSSDVKSFLLDHFSVFRAIRSLIYNGAKKVAIISFLMSLALTLKAQTTVYGANGKIKYEQEAITLRPIGLLSQPSGFIQDSTGQEFLSPMINPVLNVGLSLLQSSLKRRQEKFAALYSTHISRANFYETNLDFNLPDLELSRVYEGDNDGLRATFSVELNEEKSAFRYRLIDLKFLNSKALAKKTDKIDLQFEITFSALVSSEENSNFKEIDKHKISIRGIEFGTNYRSLIGLSTDWFPIPDFSLKIGISPTNHRDITRAEAVNEAALHHGLTLDEAIEQKWIVMNGAEMLRYIKIKDNVYRKIHGSYQPGGAYSISIIVKEVNSRKVKGKRLMEFLDTSEEDLKALVEAVATAVSKDDK